MVNIMAIASWIAAFCVITLQFAKSLPPQASLLVSALATVYLIINGIIWMLN